MSAAPAARGPSVGARQEPIRAFWCRTPSRANFGDALTPWLIRKITGTYPVFTRPEDVRHKYFAVGSIIEYADAGCTVWGAGVMSHNDWISSKARLLAVRGPLTRARALQCGAGCPEVYGDPAILLPRFYEPPLRRRWGIGVVPHFSDMPALAAAWRPSADLRLIDIQSPVEEVIDQIASCERVYSSSLHGIITSHAYGVPAARIKFHDLPNGDDIKFDDYALSIGDEPVPPVRFAYDAVRVDRLALIPATRGSHDCERLWQACPFRSDA